MKKISSKKKLGPATVCIVCSCVFRVFRMFERKNWQPHIYADPTLMKKSESDPIFFYILTNSVSE